MLWKSTLLPILFCIFSDIFFTVGCYTFLGKEGWYRWAAVAMGSVVTVAWAFFIIPLNTPQQILVLSLILGLIGAMINTLGAGIFLSLTRLELIALLISLFGTGLYLYADYRR